MASRGLWGVPSVPRVWGLARLGGGTAVPVLAVAPAIAAPAFGCLSDRWPPRRRLPMAVFAAIYVTCWIALVLPTDARLPVPWLIPFFLVMGLASSGLALVWSCGREVNDPPRVGIAIGLFNGPLFPPFPLLQW